MYYHFTYFCLFLRQINSWLLPFLEHLTFLDGSLCNAAETSELADLIAAGGILVESGLLGFGNDVK